MTNRTETKRQGKWKQKGDKADTVPNNNKKGDKTGDKDKADTTTNKKGDQHEGRQSETLDGRRRQRETRRTQ